MVLSWDLLSLINIASSENGLEFYIGYKPMLGTLVLGNTCDFIWIILYGIRWGNIRVDLTINLMQVFVEESYIASKICNITKDVLL